MAIAVGILFIDATEFEINVGGNLTPPPLDIRSVKKILDTGELRPVSFLVKSCTNAIE